MLIVIHLIKDCVKGHISDIFRAGVNLKRLFPAIDLSRLKGDIMGGLVVAILSLPMTIPLGALALSPLGPDFIKTGVSAGFHASIIAGIVAALAGGSRLQISGPRASISLLASSAVGTALSAGCTSQQALTLVYVVLLLAGCLQVVFGLAKFGRALRYLPYPVLGGFMNGVAVLIILGQLAAAAGLPASTRWTHIMAHRADICLPAILVTMATMAAMYFGPRLTKKVPAIIIAFVLGVLLDYSLRLILGNAATGPLVGLLGEGFLMPNVFGDALALPWNGPAAGWLLALAPTILVLALVASLESLLSAAAIDTAIGDRHNSNRELLGQGLSNIVSAGFGGVPSTGAPIRGIASYNAGGRTRMAGVFHSLALLALLMWGKPLLAALPYSVMAGVMIMIAISMIDKWTFTLARRNNKLFIADCSVVVLVAALTIFANLAIAVLSGVALTLVMFMLRMSRPLVNRIMDRTQIKSLKQRSIKLENFLSDEGHSIVILELKGPLFFGTAEQLRDEMDRLEARAPKVIILDFQGVTYLDLSGGRILRQIGLTQKQKKRHLYLSGIKENSPRRAWLTAADVTTTIPPANLFPLLEPALEAAEELISSGVAAGEDKEIALTDLEVLSGLTPDDHAYLARILKRNQYSTGQRIFCKGQDGDGLYLLVSGLVEIILPAGKDESSLRLGTLAPGTIFGEMALLEGKSRSADTVALAPTVAYLLSNADYALLQKERPSAAVRLLQNIGIELSARLRFANSRLLNDFTEQT